MRKAYHHFSAHAQYWDFLEVIYSALLAGYAAMVALRQTRGIAPSRKEITAVSKVLNKVSKMLVQAEESAIRDIKTKKGVK